MQDVFSDDGMKYFDHPSDAWDSKAMRDVLVKAYASWIYDMRDWSSYITLTFREETAPDTAQRLLDRLIENLNVEVFGEDYKSLIGPSYFSYVVAIEPQKREVTHFHVLVDRPVNYRRIHTLWNSWAGYAWTEAIDDKEKVVMYISKCVGRGGEITPYLVEKKYVPLERPYWWVEREDEIPFLNHS